MDDIEPLIERFLTQFNKKYGMHKTFSRETAAIMKRYSWAGEYPGASEHRGTCDDSQHRGLHYSRSSAGRSNQVQVKSGNIILDNVVDLKAHLEEIELV